MQAAITHILPLALIRRRRVLPAAGKVLVVEGQKVGTTDVIAELRQPGQHALVDVRRELGLARVDQAEVLLDKRTGALVQAGETLAQTGGLFRQTVSAPISGEIVTVSAGRVLIEAPAAPLQLQAGFSGMVREVIAERGALIETSGSLVQGYLGNDRVDQGVLVVAAKSPEDELTAVQLDVSMRGGVVLAGHCSQADAIRTAVELPLRGLILSSITADLIPVVQQASIPIIVLEGIGKIPLDPAAYQVLATNEKRDACINAVAYDPYSGARPEIVVPLPSFGELPIEAEDYAAGKTVRIMMMPYTAQVGTLVQVRPGLTRLKNGVLAPAGDVRLGNNETITVPLANLDMLE